MKLTKKTLLAGAFALSAINAAHGALVAYFPLTEGTAGTTTTTINDTIDDATHGVTDGTATAGTGTWVYDAFRDRIVLQSPENNRFAAGTQDIDRTIGFSWSLWVNVSSSNLTDTGADSIIGSRNGTWNKVDLASTGSWASISYTNLADNTWHHIAYVGDSTDVSFYIDGVKVGSDTTTPTNTVNDIMEIGGSSRFTEHANALYSDIAIYDERLTDARIAQLAAGAPVIIPEPSAALLGGLGALLLLRRRR